MSHVTVLVQIKLIYVDDVHLISSGFIPLTEFWMLFASAAEVQHVQFGSTVTLGCDISYLYDTTWLKQNPDLTPTVVTCASLREGHPVQGDGRNSTTMGQICTGSYT